MRSACKAMAFIAAALLCLGGVATADETEETYIIVGSGPDGGNRVKVFNAEGTALLEFVAFTKEVNDSEEVRVAAGDVDGDGLPEIVTAPGSPSGPNYVFLNVFKSDMTFSTITVGYALGSNVQGAHVACGDVDGDGVDEILVGDGPSGLPYSSVKVFEGDGTYVSSWTVFAGGLGGKGVPVAALDQNGDGDEEVAVSNGPDTSVPPNPLTGRYFEMGGSLQASFYAFSGARGAGGGSICSAQYDADAAEEVWIAHGPTTEAGSYVRAFDSNGTLLGQIAAFGNHNYGVDVAAIDLDDDGLDELAVGENAGATATSRIRLFERNGELIRQFMAFDGDENPQGGVHLATVRGPSMEVVGQVLGGSTEYAIAKLTDDGLTKKTPRLGDGGHVVWAAWDGSDYEIFLHDGSGVTQITNNATDDVDPEVNVRGQVAWVAKYGQGGSAVMLYDEGVTTQLTSSESENLSQVQINASGCVIWTESIVGLFLYDGSDVERIAPEGLLQKIIGPQINSAGQIAWALRLPAPPGDDHEYKIWAYNEPDAARIWSDYGELILPSKPQINGSGQIVWGIDSFSGVNQTERVYLYDGSSETWTELAQDAARVQISDNGLVVWMDPDHEEVYLYDGAGAQPISDGLGNNANPAINASGQVAWYKRVGASLFEIVVHDGGDRLTLASNLDDESVEHSDPWYHCPQINASGQVAWLGVDGADHEIYVATPVGPDGWSVASAQASVAFGSASARGSSSWNHLAFVLIPIAGVVVLRFLRRRR